MATEQDFDWPQSPERLFEERPVFLEPGESLPALHYVRTEAHHSVERSKRLFTATLIAIGHCVALLASQIIAAGVERAHRTSAQVRDGAALLDDAFPLMVMLHLVAAISVVLWALQRTPQRRAASLVAAGALHCICVAGWWTLYEMAA